ncbi:cell division protein FtsZ [Cytophagaceae bacterium DM2B3-1]|uniref:Cell division protein FtsZ n=1 Tax=Xanthocytophaga flava TaxID=3048013 RepID=A0ABT7CRI9_9BACT|nr:cell division protein FtsZ [Xanthocytophaga flavus]MDJ1468588.1 cell division protein FtsZ [Xanthocytophaga flavus]MDJ1496368.1 cell division protein FtsZ [Xanthocytophaga flavus]
MFNIGNVKFDLPINNQSIIKVIGVGGGGGNAVNHMFRQGIRDVEFVVCNTDAQALTSSPVPYKIQLGASLTEGLGAGANPDQGRAAALESEEDIKALFTPNVKMVFITAGMGGGTGTGAAPVISRIAKEMGVLTVAIVTAPFSFEGRIKIQNAFKGIDELKQYCDTVLLISNDKLLEIFGDLPKSKAFAEADNILTNAAKSIAEIITVPGYVNVDFEDVKKVMKNAGQAVIGSATAQGESRARKVIEAALNSPLLNSRDIRGAKKILVTMFYSQEAEMTMGETKEIMKYIEEKTGILVDELIHGDIIDDSLGQHIRVTIIATGFDAPENTAVKAIIESEPVQPVKVEVIPVSQPEVVVNVPAGQVNKPLPFEFSLEDKSTVGGPTPVVLESSSVVEEKPIAPISQPSEEVELFLQRKKLGERKDLRQLNSTLTLEDIREKTETPAYVRRGIHIFEPPSEPNITKHNLDD